MKNVVSTQWLGENLNDTELIILDCSPAANKSGLVSGYPDIQIKNARKLDLKAFADKGTDIPGMLLSPEEFSKESQKLGINKDSKIIVYDNLGIYTSPRVWWMFKTMGHDAVAVLDGGLPKWAKEGLQTEEKQRSDYETGNFEATLNSAMVKNAEQILQNIESKEMTTIDARSADRFYARVPEPRAGLAGGHIPNSKSLPFKKVLDQNEFKPAEELKEIFAELNPKDAPMAFTCGSGITASILYLAAELTGSTNNAVYDGSWSEWGQLEGYPVNQ